MIILCSSKTGTWEETLSSGGLYRDDGKLCLAFPDQKRFIGVQNLGARQLIEGRWVEGCMRQLLRDRKMQYIKFKKAQIGKVGLG